VAAGTCIVLVGMKILPVDPSSVHAPYWVLTVAGMSFALGGIMVWGMAWQQFAANRQRRQATRKQSNEPALTDYQWNPNGFTASEWTSAAKAVVMPIGLSIFLSMFNWWAFFAHGDWMVKAMVILFDCIALFMWWQAAQRVGCALKFGQSRIVFTRFPYRLGEPVVIRWQAGRGI
jgi:hypothetical protein